MLTTRAYALWILPRADQANTYAEIVVRLANDYRAPTFQPHVTVYGGTTADLAQTLTHFDTLAARPMRLRCCGSFQSSRFTQTFGLNFKPHPQLSSLSQRMAAHAANTVDTYQLRPHMSLLYAALAESERIQLTEIIELPSNPVTFNQMALVTPGADNDWQHVEAWQVLRLRNL